MELDAEQLGQKLIQKTDMTPKQVKNQTNQVIQEYKPLITDKTPAVIFLGQQKNIDLVEKQIPSLKIENIVPDMSSVKLKAKIIDIDKFTYTKEGEKRKGCDITLKDKTGEISVMVWGEDVQEIKESLINEHVEITNSYSQKYKREVQLNYVDETKIEKVKKN